MKKLLFTIGIIFLILPTTEAQNYKVKKGSGAVLKDKEEVARVEGKVTVFKPSYMDMYQNEELVLSMKEKSWKSPYTEFENFIYYQLDFPKLGETINVKANYSFTNEKQIVKLLMAKNGLHIYKDGFKEEEISILKNSKDVVSIEKDTTNYANLIKEWRNAISENAYEFDESTFDKISLHPIQKDPRMRPKNLPDGITHLVIRDISDEQTLRNYRATETKSYKLVGAISYINAEPEVGQTKGKHEIRVFRRVKSKVKYNGMDVKYAPIAYTDLTKMEKILASEEQSKNEYRLYMDDSLHKYLRPSVDNNPSLNDRLIDLTNDLKELGYM